MTLDLEDIDAIARRVVQLLGSARAEEGFLDARDVARRLGVRRAWVYAHARELGGVRLGEGSRGPLRFDPAAIRDCTRALAAEANPSASVDHHDPRAQQRGRSQAGTDIPLIDGRTSRARNGTA